MSKSSLKYSFNRPKLHSLQGSYSNTKAIHQLPNIIQQNNANIVKKPKSFEGVFDELMDRAQSEPISQVIELCLQPLFESTHTILWIYLENQSTLFSPSFTIFAPTADNIVAEGFRSRVPVAIQSQVSHSSFSSQIDARVIPPSQPLLMVPIMNIDSKSLGVIQFSRKQDKFFTKNEIDIATSLVSKFQTYSGFLFPDLRSQIAAASVTQFDTLPEVIKSVCASLSKIFKCRKSEIWLFKKKKNIVLRYDDDSDSAQFIDPEKCGCVGYSAQHNQLINSHSVLDQESYNQNSDGYHDENILINPLRISSKKTWCIALRGRAVPPYFSKSDEIMLRAVTPFAIRSISCAVLPSTVEEHLNEYQQRLTALLEVAEALSGVLDLENLFPLIMDRACSLLSAERCSLFLVDPIKQELVTRFAGGLSNSIRLPIGKGIVGTTATTGEIINIPDAYNDNRFDPSVDKKTGFRTKAILSLPIYNNRGEIAGVTEMINRLDGGEFDDSDIKLMLGFNVFCGISLDNAKLYNASLNLARQLRTFVELSTQLNQKRTIKASIENILENARGIVNATRASLFLNTKTNDDKKNDKKKKKNSKSKEKEDKKEDKKEDTEDLTLLVTVGSNLKYGSKFAARALAQKEIITFSPGEINSGELLTDKIDQLLSKPDQLNMLAAGSSASPSISANGSSFNKKSNISINLSESRLLKLLDTETTNADEAIEVNEQLCDIPLFSSEGQVLGVMELESSHKTMSEDIKLLESFAIFSAISIERSQLKDIATLGEQEQELHQTIAPDEESLTDRIPVKLLLEEAKELHIYTIQFDSPSWDGMGHFQVLFSIFHRFKIQQTYNITNEKLFRFFCDIRDTYNPVPYHNWRHAVDVTQFVTYEMITAKYDKILTQFEIFALTVASICHDANHDGFTNVFNVKAETPLGILFKNQSVMETHHCSVSIDVLSKPQCNLFENLEPQDFKRMWTTIIQLILATDMSKHFEILKTFQQLKEDNKYTMDDNECRLLTMKMLLKCGDISNVSRPFELADKWCDVLCEEFFRQGDLEMAHGMEYTSPNNDRAHLDKPKSQIGFYTFVCLPLFEAMAQAAPELDVNVKQVQSNLALWKKESDEKMEKELKSQRESSRSESSNNKAKNKKAKPKKVVKEDVFDDDDDLI